MLYVEANLHGFEHTLRLGPGAAWRRTPGPPFYSSTTMRRSVAQQAALVKPAIMARIDIPRALQSLTHAPSPV